MKNLYIVGKSAFKEYRYLRKYDLICKLQSTRLDLNQIDDNLESFNDSVLIDENIKNKPVDISVFEKKHIYKSNKINFHLYKYQLPNRSFLSIEKQINISNPELTFCTLANLYDIYYLILFGLEICGTYALSNDPECVFSNNLPAITSVKKIQNYIFRLHKSYGKFHGINKALEATKIINNGSASPQESRLYILLCSPRKLGGFGLKDININKPVSLSSTAKKINNKDILIPDLSNKKTKVAIEYDSNQFHENCKQNIRDKSRLNALKHDGWNTYTFVPGYWNNIEALRAMCFDILKANKQECRIRNKQWDFRNRELINMLYLQNYVKKV